jgi:hypothetical protein
MQKVQTGERATVTRAIHVLSFNPIKVKKNPHFKRKRN